EAADTGSVGPNGAAATWSMLPNLATYFRDYSPTPAYLLAGQDEAWALANIYLDLHSDEESREREALNVVYTRYDAKKKEGRTPPEKTLSGLGYDELDRTALRDVALKQARSIAGEFRWVHDQYGKKVVKGGTRPVLDAEWVYQLYVMQRTQHYVYLVITDLFR